MNRYFFLWISIMIQQTMFNTGIYEIQYLYLWINFQWIVTIYSTFKWYQKMNLRKWWQGMSFDCLDYFQQLYLIVDNFSPLSYEPIWYNFFKIGDDRLQLFIFKSTDIPEDKIMFRKNIFKVISNKSKMIRHLF